MILKEYIDKCMWDDLKTTQGVKEYMQRSLADLKSIELYGDSGRGCIHFRKNMPDNSNNVKYDAYILTCYPDAAIENRAWDDILSLEVLTGVDGYVLTNNEIVASVIKKLTTLGATQEECLKAREVAAKFWFENLPENERKEILDRYFNDVTLLDRYDGYTTCLPDVLSFYKGTPDTEEYEVIWDVPYICLPAWWRFNMEAKITQIENNLKRLEELETSTIEQLDEFILNCWAALEIANNEINDSLYIKKQREILNTFDWTTENVEKMINLNEQLIDRLEKLREVPTAAINTLNIRIKDYE